VFNAPFRRFLPGFEGAGSRAQGAKSPSRKNVKEAAMKKILIAMVAGAVALAPLAPVGAKKAKPKPVTVMTDAAGDAGNQDTGAPGAAEAGLDLVKGSIGQKGKNVVFTATHSAMPDSGSAPEAFRLIWGISVNGDMYQMTVKSVDVGKPDVVTSALTQTPTGTERVGQVYQGVVRLEQCGEVPTPAVLTFSTCSTNEYLPAVFDAAKKTVTWQIPAKAIKAKKGTQIGGGGYLSDTGCIICWVPHYGERSLTPASIVDSAAQSKSYKVK
jgi:hypothetical protein